MYSYLFSIFIISVTIPGLVQGRYRYQPVNDGPLTLHRVEATWEEANRRCRNEDAVLASPFTPQMLNDLKRLIEYDNYTQYYIGARAKNFDGAYISVEGIPLEKLSLNHMYTYLDPSDGDCLSINNRRVQVVSCDTLLPYVCYSNLTDMKIQDTTTSTTHPPSTTSDYCGAGYKYISSLPRRCYKFHSITRTFEQARAECRQENANLFILRNQADNQVIRTQFPISSLFWNGVYDVNGSKNFLTVLGESTSNIYFQWHSGHDSAVSYRCTAVMIDARLDCRNCDWEHTFVCEKDPY